MIGLLTLFTSVLLASQPVLADNTPNLFGRQVSGFDPSIIPSSCLQTKCNSLVQELQNCTQLTCLCTTAVAADLQSCFQCAVDAGVASVNATSAQQAITSFTDGCKAAGYPVSGTVSGTSGSSGSSKASASGSATGAASSSTAITAAGSKSSGTLVGVSVGFLVAVVGLATAGLSL
ncbi:hypothetical protein K443DRAFT_681010 [Laccaria amethystina LaAM-08-1]|uniref:Extracellular membrane protein CFEM domain-containing protein n=1 Tax=Laccaria amethystina LaAM-08-1 TaxID=1095629 RepID=A0A0C9WMF6_9AGAR|nr:hypothetical protein K443DRAFT_681010 [Laccaria amethystina LaAM-08-1]